jgi:hypothetical protein
VTVDQAHYGNVDYGYAATVHKSQGATVDRVHVLASPTMDAQLAYVAMTRHRENVILYAGQDDFADTDALTKKLARDRMKESTLAYEHSPDYRVAAAEFASRRGLPDMSELRDMWRETIASMRTRLRTVADRFRMIGERLSIVPRSHAAQAIKPETAPPAQREVRVPVLTPPVSQALARLDEVQRHVGQNDVKRAMWFRAADSELSVMSSARELVAFNEAVSEIVPAMKIRAAGRQPETAKVDELLKGLPSDARSFFEANWSRIHAGQMAAYDKTRLDMARNIATDRREQRIEAEYEAEQARYRTPDKPLVPAVTKWSVPVEVAARARAFSSKHVIEMRQYAGEAFAHVWREPGPILASLEQRVLHSAAQLNELLLQMEKSPARIGELHGSTSLLGRADQSRQAALGSVLPATSAAREYAELLGRSLRSGETAEKEWRGLLAEPVTDLSPAASDLVMRMKEARAMPVQSPERRELETKALADIQALAEVRGAARELNERFGDDRGRPGRDKIAMAFDKFSRQEVDGLYSLATDIAYTAHRARVVEQEIERAQRIGRDAGRDRSIGLEH